MSERFDIINMLVDLEKENTVSELGEKLNVSRQTITTWWSGKKPQPRNLVKLNRLHDNLMNKMDNIAVWDLQNELKHIDNEWNNNTIRNMEILIVEKCAALDDMDFRQFTDWVDKLEGLMLEIAFGDATLHYGIWKLWNIYRDSLFNEWVTKKRGDKVISQIDPNA